MATGRGVYTSLALEDESGPRMADGGPKRQSDKQVRSPTSVDDRTARRELSTKLMLNTRLLTAVSKNQIDEVQRLIEKGAPLIARCRESMATVVHVAAVMGHTELLKMLVGYGQSALESRDSLGRQPHHLAAASNELDALKLIISASPHLLNSKSDTTSLEEVEEQHLDSYLHPHGQVTSLLLEIPKGSTALHVAAFYENTDVMTWLLEQKADLEVTDSLGRSAVDLVGQRSQSPRPVFQGFVSTISNGVSPMTMLSRRPIKKLCVDVMNTLFSAGVQPSSRKTKNTNLHTYVEKSDVENIMVFIKNLESQGADVKDYTRAKDGEGRTPLLLAVQGRKLKELELLLDKDKECIDIGDEDGMTPIHQATINTWADGVERLLEFNPDLKCRLSKSGENVFHSAARIGHLEILLSLLMQSDGEELEAVDEKGQTPLTTAILSPSASVAVVKALMNDRSNRTVLTAKAIEADSVGKLAFLKEHFVVSPGKLRTDVVLDGMNSLQYSACKGSQRCLDYLISLDGDEGISEQTGESGNMAHIAAKFDKSEAMNVILTSPKSKHLVCSIDVKLRQPLVIASSEASLDCIELLLKNGADISARDPEKKKNALELMSRHIPHIESMLTHVLDSYGRTDSSGGSRKSTRLELSFDLLLAGSKQLQVVETFVKFDDPDVTEAFFSHPLVGSFLFLKKQRRCFVDSAAMYFVAHVFFLTVLSLATFTFRLPTLAFLATVGVWASLVPVVTMEILLTMDDWRYVADKEALLRGSVLLGSVLVTVLIGQPWCRYLASVTVVLAWIQLLFVIGNITDHGGIKVLMFFEVAINVLQVLSTFMYLMLGFGIGFLILFDAGYPFNNIWTTLTKTLIMMVELDYSGAYGEEKADHYSPEGIVGRLLYVGFVVLVVMVLSNLMVSMSVNDVSKLESAGIAKQNEKDAKYLILFEKSMAKNKCLPRILRLMFRNRIPVTKKLEGVTIFPYNRGMDSPQLPESLRDQIIARYFKPEV